MSAVIDGYNILPFTDDDAACCGIKSISMALNDDGSTSASVTGLEGDVNTIMASIMVGAYTIDSRREEGTSVTITATSVENDAYQVVPTGAIFKTIPADIYNLHMANIITRSMQSPLEAPDSDIYIRPSDMYGTDGWTCSEVISTLGIRARVPSNFDYHVYQVSVTRGTPIISFLSSLFPFPGLIIERVGSTYFVNRASGFPHIASAPWDVCSQTSKSSKTQDYAVTVVGAPGEPRGITGTSGDIVGACGSEITFNLVGGVWAVTSSTSTNTSSTSKMHAMFND